MEKIAYFGRPGSYSFFAGKNFFSEKKMVGFSSFQEIFQAVKKGNFSFGIIPWENSTTGSIRETYDLLLETDLKIVGEVILHLHHCLLGKKEIKKDLSPIKKCFSHPEAFAQCQKFFSRHPWIKPVFVQDTASAAQKVSQLKSEKYAAVAARGLAKFYSLKILAERIEDNSQNFTRFAVIARETLAEVPSSGKISLLFSLPHRPGSLVKALEPYAFGSLNLTKIESRPILGRPWEYLFFVDLEFKEGEKGKVRKILAEMKKKVNFLKVLGLYPLGKTYET